jgi:carbon-monoxide dehydrogenase large subunit
LAAVITPRRLAKRIRCCALRLVSNRLIPTCLETRAILAEPSVDGRLTIYLPSQVPHMHRRWIAETVGVPEHLLRVVAPDIDGGFGQAPAR